MKTPLRTKMILRSFCLFLFFVLTSFRLAQGQDVVPDALEYAALKDLYQSTHGIDWNNNTNWPTTWPATATSAEFGTWFGVGVSNGDVNYIQLGFNNLTGTIPASLSNLTQLTFVGLNSNNLLGEFPATALSNAHNLAQLYLDHNQLSGPLPAWSGTDFVYMQYFNLSYNQFTGAVPTSYITFSYLELLDLASNQLTSFPSAFASMTWLKDLRLSYNPFPPGPVPSWIGQMSGLTILLMGGNNFTGTIPASLGNLHNLIYLSLNYNQLTGSIPAALTGCTSMGALDLLGNQLDDMSNDLSAMTQLGYLGLSNNRFQGPLPEWFGSLSNLQQIYLNGNQFTSLPSSFSNLSKLMYVYLYDNQLTGNFPDVSRMTNLNTLHISNNKFNGTLPPSFSSLNLSFFDAGNNQLSGEFPAISNWTNLTSLNLSGNQFSGAFPSATGLNALTFLGATTNQFTSFPTSLLSLPVISYISFEDNQLIGIDNFETEVAANHVHPPGNLGNFYIDQNQLDFKTIGTLGSLGFPVYAFPQHKISDVKVAFIENDLLRIPTRPLQSTTTINWYKKAGASWVDVTADNEDSTRNTFLRAGSTLSEEGVYYWSMTDTQFPDATIQSDTIVMYFERDNMVADAIELIALKDFFESLNGADWHRITGWPATWPATATSADFATWEGVVVEHGDVVGISMNNNNLDGILPSSLSKLIRLNHFYVEGNQVKGQFPSVLFSLPKLQDLNLNSNQFTGSVPSFKQASFNLNSLRLAANLFTGAFPDLSSQTHLGYLNLSNSTFDPGSIPASLSSLINLTQLYLVDTKRTGAIPDFMGSKMAALVILYMDYNQLSGNIPNTLSQVHGLQTISLAYNQLTGSIPASFAALDQLSYMNFSHNSLSSIPAQVGDIQSLSELIVNYNNLEGPLPNELANCTFLGHLDVTGNRLTGLPDLSAQPMGALKLSHNQFSGPIPAWIASTTSIQILQLADNQFSGPLPSGLSSLNAMRELTLDHNQLTGPMPDISGWSNLYLLDVSYNQLSSDFPEIPSGVFVVDASNNAFTSIHSSAFKTTAPYYLQFENNHITTVRKLEADLSNGSIPMTPQGGFIALRYNYLDFAMLSKVKQVPINHADFPQKNINDLSTMSITVGDQLVIPSRPVNATTTIKWSKKINNVWDGIKSTNEDTSEQTFLINQASTAVEGEYFWSMNDSAFPGMTIESEPILVNLNRSRLCASMYCDGLGGVGINTQITNGFTLSVNGKIRANGDIKVTALSEWPDFVFNDNYKLPGLMEVERYILANGHLPGIPSAEEVTKEGIELVTINSKLLQKVEELTLYLIELKKERDHIFLTSEQLDKDKDQLKRQLKHLTKQQAKTQGQLK